jgi:acyl phosphate:glycerol-3-phosphate acyltransferase
MPTSSVTILLIVVLGAYLLGSIPFGLIFAKLFAGKDIREHGSGNIGAANVSRVVGPAAGIATLLFDVAKGAVAVWLAESLTGSHQADPIMFAGIAALLGHCFSVWLRFKGGKGVATALGVYLILCPLAALAALVVFLLVVVFWRYVSLGSLSAAAAMPLLVYLLWAPGHAPPLVIVVGTLCITALLFYKHFGNLQRLLDGTEPKFSLHGSKDQHS